MGLTQSGPHRYKPLEDCRLIIQKYCDRQETRVDENDPDKLDGSSATSYTNHVRWYDDWLNYIGKEPTELTGGDVEDTASQLLWEFHGTTSRNRWDRINHFHGWLVKREDAESNPYEPWDPVEDFGLTKTTEQSKHLDTDEDYACTVSDIKAMEKHPGRYEIRNQCIIRLMWHTGCRRDELASVEMRDIDFDARTIRIREEVSKTDEERYVGWLDSATGLLDMWLAQRDGWNQKEHPYLFIGERGGRIDGNAINEIIVNSAYRAGINRPLYADSNAAREILGYDGEIDELDPEDLTRDDDYNLVHKPTDTVIDETDIQYGDPIPNRDKITSHSVRHGTATKMIQDDDCDPYRVSRYCGHSSVEFTITTYVDQDSDDGLPALDNYRPDEDTSN
jgi:integrase/recombinase XerD